MTVVGGTHAGPLVLDRSIELVGHDWPVIEGNGRGTVISLTAADVRITGLVIRGSGASLDQENSGIAADEAPGSEITGNRFEDVLFGVYLRKSPGSLVAENEIRSKRLEIPRRGDAIRVWYSNDVRLEDNRVTDARDVVLWYSERLTVHRNTVSGGRYGLHFMYCDDASIEGNLLKDNSVGAFLMYSRRLRLIHNTIVGNHGPSGFGIGLKDMDDAQVRENRFIGNRVGVFLDNSPRETGSSVDIGLNLIAGNDIGVSLLPNVKRGRFFGNSFVENQQQVEIAGGGGDPLDNEWRENFWSDYVGYDGDADGTGDVAYRADRLFEDLADRQPALKLFLHSPAKDALELAARTLPLIRPRPKLTDERPRMRPHDPDNCPSAMSTGGNVFGPLGASFIFVGGALLLLPGAVRRGVGQESGDVEDGDESQSKREPSIRVVGLTKRFGHQAALRNVSFEIREGESVAVWGPNGAGKTTLLRVLLGVIPRVGTVTVAGVDPWRRGKTARARIGFVPQEVSLQREMRVDETLAFFSALRSAHPERPRQLVEDLGLLKEVGKKVGELSGGQRQRLVLALALLSDPPILILDEPTANLDARARADFIELLRDLKNSGRTLVFSSHRPEEVQAVADRVLHLEAGRLVADEPPSPEGLESHRTAEMWLRVAPQEIDLAVEALEARGIRTRRLGEHLVAEIGAGQKLEPIRELLTRGIALESFEIDVSESGGRDDAG